MNFLKCQRVLQRKDNAMKAEFTYYLMKVYFTAQLFGKPSSDTSVRP